MNVASVANKDGPFQNAMSSLCSCSAWINCMAVVQTTTHSVTLDDLETHLRVGLVDWHRKAVM